MNVVSEDMTQLYCNSSGVGDNGSIIDVKSCQQPKSCKAICSIPEINRIKRDYM